VLPDQQAELRTRTHADPKCAGALAARDCASLAALLSAGRTCGNDHEIGYGTILETLGIDAGNKLIDHIQGEHNMRHVVPLLDRGALRIGSPLVQATLRGLPADVITTADVEKLCALGQQDDPLTAQQVAEALFYPDGSEK